MIPAAWLPRSRTLLAALLLLGAGASAVHAQAEAFPVTGRLTDANQVVVVGYRVVFREPGTGEIFLSPPTDLEGSYRLDVPTGVNLQPVAVLSPVGTRLPLEGLAPQVVLPGVRFDIELSVALVEIEEPRPFPGADRLFRSFIEDTAFVERQRIQAQVYAGDFEDATSYISEVLWAYNFMALPRFELGARAGYAGTEFDPEGGATGATDIDLYGKLLFFDSPSTSLRAGAGALLTLPTGEPETGRATGAFGTKLFAMARYGFGRVWVSGHAGARFTADTEIDGVDRNGEVSGSLGGAALVPFGDRICGVVEVAYESARYEDGEDEGAALVGVNWKVFREGILRLSLRFGLADGSPDAELAAGYAFEF